MLPAISEVVQMAGFQAQPDKLSYYIQCPFCDDTGKHLNINNTKDTFNCPRCGTGGGIVDFYSLLYKKPKEISLKELRNISKKGSTASLPEFLCKKPQRHLSAEKLNKVYSALLEELYLSFEDQKRLLNRDLSIREIERFKFKSVFGGWEKETAQKLIEKGISLESVPGFARTIDGTWYFTPIYKGYLIPFINYDGNITGLQIRCTRKEDQTHKYVWLSSFAVVGQNAQFEKQSGTKAFVSPHLIGYNHQKTIYLTEGGLKGDIAHSIIKRIYGKNAAFMCIAGVNNKTGIEAMLNFFKKEGVTKIYNCLDMDRNIASGEKFNPHVHKASYKLMEQICKKGFETEEKVWPAQYKGIDDYLSYLMQMRQKELQMIA